MCRRASGHSAVSWRINGTNREEKRRTLMEGEELVQRILQVDLNKSLAGTEFITINRPRQQRSRGVWHVAYVTTEETEEEEEEEALQVVHQTNFTPLLCFSSLVKLYLQGQTFSFTATRTWFINRVCVLPARVFVPFSSQSCVCFFFCFTPGRGS